MKPAVFCAVIAAPFIVSTGANAQACAPLKQLASIKLTKSDNGKWLVPVTINASPSALLLNTGAATSGISPTGADTLKLARMEKRNDKLVPSTGDGPEFVMIESLVLGSGRFSDSEFRVESTLPGQTPTPAGAAGQLGLDVLTRFDFDMDFAAGTLNLFDLEHCSGQVVYWKTTVAVAVPFIYDVTKKIRAMVTVDGKPINATIDTSSDVNKISIGNAKLLMNFDENAPGVEKLPDDADGTQMWRMPVKTLDLEGLGIQNTSIVVTQAKAIPTATRGRVPNAPRVSVDTKAGELTLGMGLLSKLHVYVAAKERKLYISPASQ